MALLSPKEAVMLGKPICFKVIQPPCRWGSFFPSCCQRFAALPWQLLLSTCGLLLRLGDAWLIQSECWKLWLWTASPNPKGCSVVLSEVDFFSIKNSRMFMNQSSGHCSRLKSMFFFPLSVAFLVACSLPWRYIFSYFSSFFKTLYASGEQMGIISVWLPSWLALLSQNCLSTFRKAFIWHMFPEVKPAFCHPCGAERGGGMQTCAYYPAALL